MKTAIKGDDNYRTVVGLDPGDGVAVAPPVRLSADGTCLLIADSTRQG